MELTEMPAMEAEYQAWQDVVREWDEVVGESMNDPRFNPLVAAIRRWGETLVGLRALQTEEQRMRAWTEQEVVYAEVRRDV